MRKFRNKKVMKNIMIKSICAIAIISCAVLACSQNIFNFGYKQYTIKPVFDKDGYWKTPDFIVKLNKDMKSVSLYSNNSLYGAYLAGRVAHLRQDFDTAAEYYKIVINKDKDNLDINRSIYIILTSLGQIDEASTFAQKEIDEGQKNTLAPLIVAIKNFADGNYAEVRKNIDMLDDPVYKTIINPLFYAWSYAGEKNEKDAIESIDKIIKDPALNSVKSFHKALIYDYLGNKEKANEMFSDIVMKTPQDVTYRILEIITDFYVRSGDKNMAKQISNKYNSDSTLAILLSDIDKRIDSGFSSSEAIINTPKKGLAEALFNIGTIFRVSQGGTEFAQIYISASSYLNPEYDVSKIALASIMEEVGLLKEANKYYSEIEKESGSYFIARIKMIENYNTLKEYEKAEENLKKLLKDYPNNFQLLSDLGHIASGMNKNKEAIKIYNKAISSLKNVNSNSWPIFYALAVSYDRIDQKDKAEENLQKALKLSNRNPNVLNYLGYTWLTNNKNTDEAINMIIEAYKQHPFEGHIIDSLGWVYFKIGEYDKSIEYLEQASDLNPGNAVISDHLGDAYWFGGRRNEAVFQWKHALVLKEDSESVDKKAIQAKIEDGIVKNNIIKINDMKVKEELSSLDTTDEKNN